MTNTIDKTIGYKIRQLRLKRGFTHQQLADALQIPDEVLKLYEDGALRVGAQNLWRLAEYLDISVTDFFDLDKIDVPANLKLESIWSELKSNPEAADLARAYYALPESQRKKLLQNRRNCPEK